MSPSGTGLSERRQRASRNEIVRAAVRLLERQEYSATTLEQITEEADISLRTFYRYFPSKDAILTSKLPDGLRSLRCCVECGARGLGARPGPGTGRADP